ncbi:hypothetical protein ALC57_06512 [Trachymyrmex cornetzi]|uniref:Uncharacterized protein n=1 Tax=Trachymyrmex cornetzi TaxID=471704 RepID=A0A151J8E3_9HYME|nr:hypothetical protein ALC57_06512 [Trachymyrmex cornetzi]
MPPHSLLLHSRSFRPLRNTFRSIDFAVDTQAEGEGEHIGRKGSEREQPKRKGARHRPRKREKGRKRRNERNERIERREEKEMMETGSARDREETRAGDRVQLPTYLRG